MDVSVIERFYSKIFTTPKKRYSVALGITTIVLASILNGISSKAFFAQRYFFLALFIILAIVIFGKAIHLAFNDRRAFFLALLILIFIEIFDMLVIHLKHPNLIILAPTSMASLITITMYFTSESDEKRVCFLSFLMLMMFYPINYFYSFNAPHRLVAYLLSSFLGVTTGYLFIKYLNKDVGFNVKEFLKAFLLFWLTTNPHYFERKLEKIGVEKNGWVRCLRIGDTKLISTSFHPGPIRNIGGAKIVERILEKGNTIYLHSATTHANNLVSEKEVEKVVSSIKCNGKRIDPMEPYIIEGEKYKLIVFPFKDFKLIVVSGKNEIDDLPEEIQSFAEKFGDVLIVDAHNSFEKEFEIEREDVEEIKSLIKRAAERRGMPTNLKYVFFKEKINSKNICGYIALLLLKCKSKYAILMIDSNNIKREFRAKIEDYIKAKGYYPVVISTDNHSKTGVSPKIGYKPAGDDESDVKSVFKFLESKLNLKFEFRDAEISYSKKEVVAKVMGEKFFEDVEKAFLSLGQKALYLFAFIILIQILVTILLGLTIL